jgi:hypothetical protein
LTGAPALDLPRGEALRTLAKVVPENAALTLTFSFPADRFAAAFAGTAAFQEWESTLGLSLEKDLAPLFAGNLVFFVRGFSQADNDGVADFGLALSLKKGRAEARQKLLQLVKTMMVPKREETPEKGIALLRFDEEQRPALALSTDWLLLASCHPTLEEMRLGLAQKRPTLLDDAVAGKAILPLDARGTVQGLLQPDKLAAAMLRHLTYLAKGSGSFTAEDVERKIAPLTALLSRLPPLAWQFEPWNGNLKGRIVPLE